MSTPAHSPRSAPWPRWVMAILAGHSMAVAQPVATPIAHAATAGNVAGNVAAVTLDAVASLGGRPAAASGHRTGWPGGRWWPGLAWSLAAWLLAVAAVCWWVGTPAVVVELVRAEHTVSHTLPSAPPSTPPATTPTTAARAAPELGPHPGPGPGVLRAGFGGLLAQGDDYGGEYGGTAPDLKRVLRNLVNFLLDLAKGATIAAIALGGLTMAVSGGSTTWYARGKLAVQAGLGGFCLAFLATAIVNAADGIVRGGAG